MNKYWLDVLHIEPFRWPSDVDLNYFQSCYSSYMTWYVIMVTASIIYMHIYKIMHTHNIAFLSSITYAGYDYYCLN